MTNEEIIYEQRLRLMEEGVIGTTGRFFIGKDEGGNEVRMNEPEEIHTFQHWKELGYTVKKGQHAVAKFRIWKCASKAKNEEAENESREEEKNEVMFQKIAAFFTVAQTEKINA